MSDSLWLHKLQHSRLPCPLLSPRVCSNSCSLSQWCYLTISFSAAPFSSSLQSFPTSGSFSVSQLFAQVARVLEFQHQSFQRIFRIDGILYWFGLFSCFLLLFLGFWLSAFSCVFVFIERCGSIVFKTRDKH